jgi:hypothetical protein
MAKCGFRFWNKFREFFFFLSQDKQEDMKTILEGIDPAKHQVRVAFDACKLLYRIEVIGNQNFGYLNSSQEVLELIG